MLILPDKTLMKVGLSDNARITVGLESSISEAFRIGFGPVEAEAGCPVTGDAAPTLARGGG